MPAEKGFMEKMAEQVEAAIQNPGKSKNASLFDKIEKVQDMASKIKNAKEFMKNRRERLDDAKFLKIPWTYPIYTSPNWNNLLTSWKNLGEGPRKT